MAEHQVCPVFTVFLTIKNIKIKFIAKCLDTALLELNIDKVAVGEKSSQEQYFGRETEFSVPRNMAESKIGNVII